MAPPTLKRRKLHPEQFTMEEKLAEMKEKIAEREGRLAQMEKAACDWQKYLDGADNGKDLKIVCQYGVEIWVHRHMIKDKPYFCDMLNPKFGFMESTGGKINLPADPAPVVYSAVQFAYTGDYQTPSPFRYRRSPEDDTKSPLLHHIHVCSFADKTIYETLLAVARRKVVRIGRLSPQDMRDAVALLFGNSPEFPDEDPLKSWAAEKIFTEHPLRLKENEGISELLQNYPRLSQISFEFAKFDWLRRASRAQSRTKSKQLGGASLGVVSPSVLSDGDDDIVLLGSDEDIVV